SVKNIWFVIDTSGSMSDKDITDAFSEIVNAIEQFNGKLEGTLSFMEAGITDPVPFASVEDVMNIKPIGNGGTSFISIFNYLKNNLINNPPSQIIIITDGYDVFPEEKVALGIPVLWLINNKYVNPPWGRVARIKK
ncbi:MAG: VWA-like domain-containing protein, partial [Clostridia bacterium]|nr:VWA-like domain-containing protein [Clostridia bacterium]